MDNHSLIYDKNTVEFVTIAAEFCVFLEKSAGRNRHEFVETLLKLLPMLYLKAELLPKCVELGTFPLEELVKEGDYEYIRGTAADILGEQDDYLDVFVEDMKYSDKPIVKDISEDLADIYQDVRNFVGIYKIGFEDTMYDAIAKVRENFELYWGQTLVNTMRALHDVYYNQHIDSEDNKDED